MIKLQVFNQNHSYEDNVMFFFLAENNCRNCTNFGLRYLWVMLHSLICKSVLSQNEIRGELKIFYKFSDL